jgi:hypothetical protein
VRAALAVFTSLCVVLITACGGSGPTVSPATSTVPVSSAPTPSAFAASPAAAIVGNWARVQSCQDQLAAFQAAGLAETHATWITENWLAAGASPSASGDLCAGAKPPVEHLHFFTADGQFGSRDENGQQVDDGDYAIVDADTLAFPSHAHEFGYVGDLLVDFAVRDDQITFAVDMPPNCESACGDAYAWAISAFFGPEVWSRK